MSRPTTPLCGPDLLLAASRPRPLSLRASTISRKIAPRSRVAVNLAARDLLHKASTSAGLTVRRSCSCLRLCSAPPAPAAQGLHIRWQATLLADLTTACKQPALILSCAAVRPFSKEAGNLPSLPTKPDVRLYLDDGGCLPAHAAVLDLHSPLLAEGLQQARAGQQSSDEELLLQIPQASTAQLHTLLQLAYSPEPVTLAYSLDALKRRAELAALLQFSHALRRLQVIMSKSGLISEDNVMSVNLWAMQQDLSRVEEYTGRFIIENRSKIKYETSSDQNWTLARVLHVLNFS